MKTMVLMQFIITKLIRLCTLVQSKMKEDAQFQLGSTGFIEGVKLLLNKQFQPL